MRARCPAPRDPPEPQRDAERVRTRAQERDSAVHPAAHGDGDAPRVRHRLEGLAESGRERLDRERLAPHRCRLEERQADERLLEPGASAATTVSPSSSSLTAAHTSPRVASP
jgi:hypothetical protein